MEVEINHLLQKLPQHSQLSFHVKCLVAFSHLQKILLQLLMLQQDLLLRLCDSLKKLFDRFKAKDETQLVVKGDRTSALQ